MAGTADDTMTDIPVQLDDAEIFESVRVFFEETIPFNKVLGLRIGHIRRGDVSLVMPFKPELIGNPMVPALHGGTLSALSDAAGGAAVFSALPLGDSVSTIDLRIDFLRPAAPVESVAEARIVRLGGRVGVARVRVWQAHAAENESREARTGDEPERVLVAESTGVYSIKRQRGGGSRGR